MNALKENLKKIGSAIVSVADWVGRSFGAILTVFSAVLGFLYVRQKRKAESLQTDLELKDITTQVENQKQRVNDAKQEADNSLSHYQSLKSKYDEARKGD